MKIFDKENLDFLSASPGNYIFKNKANKSEFGKFSSIFHLLASIVILIFYLIFYIKGTEYSVIYSKINKIPENKNDDYKYYNASNKTYKILLQTENKETIKDYFNFTIYSNIELYYNKYYIKEDKILIIEFNTSDIFGIYVNKTDNYNISSNILYIDLYYTTSSMNDQKPIAMKENDIHQSESFVIDLKTKNYNDFYLKKNYIVYRDGIRLKNFLSYLFFWTHDETTYIDFYYNNYFYVNYNNDYSKEIAYISNYNTIEMEPVKIIDYYQRKYESFFNTLSKWCGIFSMLKILFSSLVNYYSFSYNNNELI